MADQKDRYSENNEKGLKGYMTLEAAMIFPAVFALIIMLLYATFFLYDKCRMTQDLYTAAYRMSILRGSKAAESKTESSGYLMLSGCETQISGGSTVRASALGEMSPALLTGTDESGRKWEIKVTMEARKTDPPYAFRRFRRIAAIASQALSQGD